MDNTKTIRFNWDALSNSGSSSLIVNINVLKEYALPPLLHGYKQDIGLINYFYNDNKIYLEAQAEVNEYEILVGMHKLSDESPYHSSHILYLLVNYITEKNLAKRKEEVKRILLNQLCLLKALLNVEDYTKYNIELFDNVGKFKYNFGTEPSLKKNVFKYIIKEVSTQLKSYNPRLYKLLISGATENQLEQAVATQTDSEIKKLLVAELAKKIVKYLNNETIVLHHAKQTTPLSISNAQGDFIYDILTHFRIYKPKQQSKSFSVVKHHDTIRKIIKRAAILDEDKEILK
jgi:hypothetical protein